MATTAAVVRHDYPQVELAADFVHCHGLDDVLIPTVAQLLTAEVRNWVEFETRKAAAAQARALQAAELERECRHHLLATSDRLTSKSLSTSTAAASVSSSSSSSSSSVTSNADTSGLVPGMRRSVTRAQPFQLSTGRRRQVLLQVPYEVDSNHQGVSCALVVPCR
jgi:cobalamin biosynthesis Mg chelatase CobN